MRRKAESIVGVKQGEEIFSLQQYFKWNNLPIDVDSEGICNGLSAVYCKYALEGRHQEFEDILDVIRGKRYDTALDSKVNQFVYEVLECYRPQVFDKRMNQGRSYEVLSSNGAPLKKATSVGLVTSDSNWANIFKEISQEGDSMMVSCIDHTVAVSKKDGKYILYDPNTGQKTFDDEASLVKALHSSAFGFNKKSPMGLSVSVIANPKRQESKPYPTASDLYRKYLDKENVNQKAAIGDTTYTSLVSAADYDDGDAIRTLFDLGADDPDFRAGKIAVGDNNTNALKAYLEKMPNIPYGSFFMKAVESGRLESYEMLKRHDGRKFNLMLEHDIQATENNLKYLIEGACKSGNSKLLEKLFDDIKSRYPEEDLSPQITDKAIKNAIGSGMAQSLEILYQHKDMSQVPEDDMMNYLQYAIEKNMPNCVDFYLQRISDEKIQQLTVSKKEAQKADIFILKKLQGRGAQLSEGAQQVMQEKANRPTGLKHRLGVTLAHFTFYLKAIKHELTSRGIIQSNKNKGFPRAKKPQIPNMVSQAKMNFKRLKRKSSLSLISPDKRVDDFNRFKQVMESQALCEHKDERITEQIREILNGVDVDKLQDDDYYLDVVSQVENLVSHHGDEHERSFSFQALSDVIQSCSDKQCNFSGFVEKISEDETLRTLLHQEQSPELK